MFTDRLNCCALNEIADLNAHSSGASAMKAFCENFEVYNTGGQLTRPGTYYIFSGVIKVRKGTPAHQLEHSTRNLKYAPRFAQYIRDNNLGTVVDLPARRNRLNAPGHLIKPYVWTPNFIALQKWWKANRTRRR